MPPLKDRTGQKYGRLTVLKRAENINGRTAWICQCDCGNICTVLGDSLQAGNTRSCGCLNNESRSRTGRNNKIDLTNQRFGKLTVIKDTGKRIKKGKNGSSIVWLCECDCGNFCEVEGGNLKSGNTMSCGCLGKSQGEYLIEALLKENNIQYENNRALDSDLCCYKKPLRFDFIIFNKSGEVSHVIEYDGEQHFKELTGSWSQGELFKTIRERDLVKNHYCFENNIPIIRIPYTVKDPKLTDVILETTNYLLTPENEEVYYGI